jgi:hypothetical protein
MLKLFLLLCLLVLVHPLNAYQSQEKLKVLLIGKLAKYITWPDPKEHFVITVLNDDSPLFEEIYHGKTIKNKDVVIHHINSIDALQTPDILYISQANKNNLATILEKTRNKHILLISDIRGFADKGGTIQIYFASQKIRLRVNLTTAKREKLKIKSSLLRIVTIVQEDEN